MNHFRVNWLLTQRLYDHADQPIGGSICKKDPIKTHAQMKIKTGKHDRLSETGKSIHQRLS